jgi:formylglycine-generating enzyme required for sulfatase activity
MKDPDAKGRGCDRNHAYGSRLVTPWTHQGNHRDQLTGGVLALAALIALAAELFDVHYANVWNVDYARHRAAALTLRPATPAPVRHHRPPSSVAALMALGGAASVLPTTTRNIYFAEARPPGPSFRDCAECPEMVVMPTGSFLMGPSLAEPARDPNESPQHRVTINYRFAVGKYPVRRDEYGRFAAESGSSVNNEWRNPGFRQTGSHPVVNISWSDAKLYTKWLSRKTGDQYRLLSEAEYEYALRAGTTTRYWWGNDDDHGCVYANWYTCQHVGTVPVGSYRANTFGLYDMAGNVWEWVEDCYHSNYSGAPLDGSAWTTGDCGYRVLRGCAWYDYTWDLRSARRGRDLPAGRGSSIGFRVARTF